MAMLCSKYNRECEGCGECMELDPPMYCPHCDRPLVYGDKVFKLDGDVIGCEYCITKVDAEDELMED